MLRRGSVLLVVAAALAAPAAADTPTLDGHVGPGFDISLSSGGADVTHLDPGTYGLHVVDESDLHDFHLSGPGGVDVVLGQTGQGTFDQSVTLAAGTYRFFCDFHPTTMKGSFTVGTVVVPAAPQKLAAGVSRAGKVTFARSAAAGKAVITVRDLSAKDNFHLRGPGVNKKTGIAFKGTVTWTVTLQSGTYTYRSDAHAKSAHTLTVS